MTSVLQIQLSSPASCCSYTVIIKSYFISDGSCRQLHVDVLCRGYYG